MNWNDYNYETNFCYVKDIRVLWILDWPVKKFSVSYSFSKIWQSLYSILNEGDGGTRASNTRAHGGDSFSNKNFQILELMMKMKIVITLYIYLFLRQLIKNRSIVLAVFFQKKTKKFQKIAFCIESKAEFLEKLEHNNLKNSHTFCIAKAKHGNSSETYELVVFGTS